MAFIRYSRSTKHATKTVAQCGATSEDDFIDKILADVASAKYQQFFCAPVQKGKHPKGLKKLATKAKTTGAYRLMLNRGGWRGSIVTVSTASRLSKP